MALLLPLDEPKQICTSCNKSKYVTEFPFHKHSKNGYDSRCKECKKEQDRDRKFLKKISPSAPNPPICQCCNKLVDTLHFDHDHKFKTFRGWICEPCNLGIGKLGDAYKTLLSATIYMAKVYNKKEDLEILEKMKNNA